MVPYRDDLFVIVPSYRRAKQVMHILKRHCNGVFKLEVEGISRSELQYLNVVVYKSSNGLYATKPYFKATSLARPLGEDSLHHYRIHLTWPKNVVRTLFAISTERKHAITAREAMCLRFKKYGASDALLRILNTVQCTTTIARSKSGDFGLWIVLPYHPI